MTTIRNSTPRVIAQGVDDQSVPAQLPQIESVPIHTPLFYLQLPSGHELDAQLVMDGSEFERFYGAAAADPRGPYHNHATALALAILRANNPVFVKRIVRPTIINHGPVIETTNVPRRSKRHLYVGIKGTTSVDNNGQTVYNNEHIFPYQRDLTGKVILDAANRPVFKINAGTETIASRVSSLTTRKNAAVTAHGQAVVAAASAATDVTSALQYLDAAVLNYEQLIAGPYTDTNYGIAVDNIENANEQYITKKTERDLADIAVANAATLVSDLTNELAALQTFATANPSAVFEPVSGGVKLKIVWSHLDNWSIPGCHTTYRVLSSEAAFIGKDGDNTGIRIWSANGASSSPADPELIADQEAAMYNAMLVKRSTYASENIIENTYGDSSVLFAFKQNAFDAVSNKNLDITSLVTDWTDDGYDTGAAPVNSPLGSIAINYNTTTGLPALLDAIYAAESSHSANYAISADSFPASKWLMDFTTCTTYSGIHYYGVQLDTSSDLLLDNRSYFLLNGNDGALDNESYEITVVDEILNNYENEEFPLIDSARYPFSCVYDSGFSMSTYGGKIPMSPKVALFKWLDYRKSVHVGSAVYTYGDAPYSLQTEISRGLTLRIAALMHVESSTWGTGAYRAVIMQQNYTLLDSPNLGKVPTTFELALKRANFMGAIEGGIKTNEAYDVNPKNIVSFGKDISHPYMPQGAKTKAWNGGLTYAQRFDRKSNFFAAFHTVAKNQSSVLTGDIFMQICCDVQAQSDKVWKVLTGRSDLSEAEMIKESNDWLIKFTSGRYGNRVDITPDAYYTPADSARGYSWTLDVTVSGSVAETVATINIITKRRTTGA